MNPQPPPPPCPGCGQPVIYPLVCLGCGLVLAPRPLPDYFALFGLPVSHRLDTPRLETAYKKLSMALHPDFHSGSEAFLRQKVLQYSSLVNTAYGVLKDEFRRAGYLLGLLAGQTALDAARLPPDFLEEMFLLQETLEVAGEAEPIPSSGGPRPALDAIQLSARTRLDALKTQREDLFALAEAAMQQTAGVHTLPDRAILQAIRTNLNQQTYLQRLVDNLTQTAG